MNAHALSEVRLGDLVDRADLDTVRSDMDARIARLERAIAEHAETRQDGVRFLRRTEVCERTGLTVANLYKLMACGKFPRPVKLGGTEKRQGNAGWRSDEIEGWINLRIAERDLRAGKRGPGRPAKNPWLVPAA